MKEKIAILIFGVTCVVFIVLCTGQYIEVQELRASVAALESTLGKERAAATEAAAAAVKSFNASQAEWEGKYTALLDAAAKEMVKRQTEIDAMRSKLEESRSGKVSDPRVPTGTKISVGEINLREIKQSSDYIYYAWTAKIANPLAYTATANTRIFMYDDKGFLLEDQYGDKQNIPAMSYAILSGNGMLEKHLWGQVDRYRVELK